MNHNRLAAALLTAAVCALPALSTTTLAAQADDSQPQRRARILELPAGKHEVLDLIQLAERQLEVEFLVNPDDFAEGPSGPRPIDLAHPRAATGEAAIDLLSQLLWTRNYGIVELQPEADLYRVVNVQGPARAEFTATSPFRSNEEILRRRASRLMTSTVVTLEHSNANMVVNSLRPFFMGGQSGSGIMIGNFGDGQALMIAGPMSSVAYAIDMIRVSDRAPDDREETRRRLEKLEGLLRSGQPRGATGR